MFPMGRIVSIILSLLFAAGEACAAVPAGYEWWFDNDVSSSATGAVSGESFDLQIDVSGLPKGIHYFNCRLNTTDSVYGSVYRKMFFMAGNKSGATSYEYWFDNDHAGKIAGNVAGDNISFAVDVTGLVPGLHYFNSRLYSDGWGWGSVYRKMFFIPGADADAVAYEYWLDNDYDKKKEGELVTGANAYSVDLEGMKKGLHRFNYRMRNGAGEWGSVFSRYFFHATKKTPFTNYEYWLDNDYANRKSGRTDSNPVTFDVDLSGFDKSGTAHYFHMRVRDDDGEWSSFYRKVIVFYGEDEKVPIIGYRHSLNGKSLGYVPVDRKLTGSHAFTVDLPEDLGISLRDMKLTFSGDEVSVEHNDTVNYTIQTETDLGWSVPSVYDVAVSESHTATVEDMAVPSARTFEKPSGLKFHAVRFTSAGGPLYVKATQSACLDIYKDGTKVAALTAADMAANKVTRLEAGTYIGILYDVPVDKENPDPDITLRLMDTENCVPAPEITYASGKVSMSCRLEGTEIRYTTDGTTPAAGSALYTAPFAVDRNMTVRAIALLPGSDLADSEVATLVIDSFKVGNPRIDFINLEMVITPDQTEGVRTYYTLDGTVPTEESMEYTSPFRLTGNAEVKVRSFKKDYKPSDIVTYSYVHAVYVALSPTISVDGTRVTLTARTDGSQIYYGINNPDVTAMTAYGGPFEISGNGTIYAFARKAGMYDSEVVSYVVGNLRAAAPVLRYNGRFLSIDSGDPAAVVRYNIDSDSDPAADGIEYDGTPIDVGGLVTVKAVAIKSGYGNSETVTLPVKGYGTEEKAMTAEPGVLASCYEWNGGGISAGNYSVAGALDESDFGWLCKQTSVRHLDLSGVTDTVLPDKALAMPELVSVVMPSALRIADNVFGSVSGLCAIDWTSEEAVHSGLVEGVGNANLLLYVGNPALAESVRGKVANIVSGLHAEKITLTEGNPFYCPKEFTAGEISYSREFTKQTGIDGDCAGWETIALPFDVETVTHAKGELKPFSVNPETEQLRYWLYAPDVYEWQRAERIEAYRPYLIAMPDNPAYYEPFNVGGTVTFSAKNATVAATPENLGFDFKGSRRLHASFSKMAAGAGVLSVNDETYESGGVSYAPGSQFVAGVRDVRPFEAYLTAERSLLRASIFSRSEVEDLMADMEMKVWSEGNAICILSGFSAKIRIYDTTGQLVRIADVKAGETCRIDDLNAGIYIVGNFKLLL